MSEKLSKEKLLKYLEYLRKLYLRENLPVIDYPPLEEEQTYEQIKELIEAQAELSEAEVGEFIGEQAHLFKRQWPDRFYGDGSIDFYVFDNLKKVLKEYDKLRRGGWSI